MEQLLKQLERIVIESEATNSFSKAYLLEMICKALIIENKSENETTRNSSYIELYRAIKNL